MSFDDYWQAVRKKFPQLRNGVRVTVPVADLEKMLRQAHGEGFAQGKTVSKSLFETVFGPDGPKGFK